MQIIDGKKVSAQVKQEVKNETELLKKAGLTTTYAAMMCLDLRKNGVRIEKNVLTTEELAEELCKLK